MVTREYPELRSARWMASLGDAVHRPRMLETVFGPGLKDRLAITGPLMLDSGGFTLMTRPGTIGLPDVLRTFVRSNADVVISLDHPPLATDGADERRIKYALTLSNYEFLYGAMGPARLAPVVHGTTPQEVEANCESIGRIHSAPPWVCLGGQVPLLRQCGQRNRAEEARRRLDENVALVRSSFPTSRLHVLGAGAPRTVAAAFARGADSVDSIGWRRAAGFGAIFLPGGTERFVADRARKRAGSRLMLTDADRAALGECGCPPCTRAGALSDRVVALSGSYLPRAAHNAWVLMGEAASW